MFLKVVSFSLYYIILIDPDEPLSCQDGGFDLCLNLLMNCEDTLNDGFKCSSCVNGTEFYAQREFGCKNATLFL